MKKIILSCIVLTISLSMQAQKDEDKSGDGNNYCVLAGAIKIDVVYRGIVMVSDVILDNGTKVEPDGTIIAKDGKITLLRVGECINQDGTISGTNKKQQQ